MLQLEKQRVVIEQQQANEIRAASAKTLAALERWRLISQSYFDEIQPLLWQTGAMAQHDTDESKARDFLYGKAHEYHARISQRLLDEKIETSYVEMYRFHPSIKPFIESVIRDLT